MRCAERQEGAVEGKQYQRAAYRGHDEHKRSCHAEHTQRRSGNQWPEREAELAPYGEDADARSLLLPGNEVGEPSSFGVEHGHADAADYGRGHDKGVVGKNAYAGDANARQGDSQRHQPRALRPIAQPAEQGLDDGRRRIGGKQQCRYLHVRIAVVQNQKRHHRHQRALVQVVAQVRRHQQIAVTPLRLGRS